MRKVNMVLAIALLVLFVCQVLIAEPNEAESNDQKLAKKLAESYEIDFSIRKLMKDQGFSIPGFSNIFN